MFRISDLRNSGPDCVETFLSYLLTYLCGKMDAEQIELHSKTIFMCKTEVGYIAK